MIANRRRYRRTDTCWGHLPSGACEPLRQVDKVIVPRPFQEYHDEQLFSMGPVTDPCTVFGLWLERWTIVYEAWMLARTD